MANWFVRLNGDDDLGDGSTEAPYRTITKALGEISSSDTIIVGDGDFATETKLVIPCSCTIQAEHNLGDTTISYTFLSFGDSFWSVEGNYTVQVKDLVVGCVGANDNVILKLSTINKGLIIPTYCYFWGNSQVRAVQILSTSDEGGIGDRLRAYKCTFRNLSAGIKIVQQVGYQYAPVSKVKDCIFSDCTTGIVGVHALTETNNCFYNNGTDIDSKTLDVSDITTDPIFKNAYNTALGFELAWASPCKDAGIEVATYVTEYLGAAPDMGCYEEGAMSDSLTLSATLAGEIESDVLLKATLKQLGITDEVTLKATLKDFISDSSVLKGHVSQIVGSAHRDSFFWEFPGLISTGTQVGGTKFVGGPCIIKGILVYLKGTGSAGTTTVDINKVSVDGAKMASIFTDPDDRPSIAYDASSNIFLIFPEVPFLHGEGLSVDLDAVGTDAEDLTVVAITESQSGKRPRVLETLFFEDAFSLSRDHLVESTNFTIKCIFSQAMDETSAPIVLSLVSKNVGVDDIVLTDYRWESTYLKNDTFVVYNINVSEPATFLFELSGLKDKVDITQEAFTTRVEFFERDFIHVSLPYLNTSTATVNITTTTATQMAFSMNGSTWSSWEAIDIVKSLDVTNAAIGGNSSEGLKTIYAKFKDIEGNETLGLDSYAVYYYVSALTVDLLVLPLTSNQYFIGDYFKASYLVKWKPTSNHLIPFVKTEFYLDDVLLETVGFSSLWVSGIVPTCTFVPVLIPEEEITEAEFKITATAGVIYNASGVYTSVAAETTGKTVTITDFTHDFLALCYVDSSGAFNVELSAGFNPDLSLGLETMSVTEKLQAVKEFIDQPADSVLIGYIYFSCSGGFAIEDILKSLYSPIDHFYLSMELPSGTFKARIYDSSGAYADSTFLITSDYPKVTLRAYTDETKTVELTSGQIYNYDSVYYEWEENI